MGKNLLFINIKLHKIWTGLFACSLTILSACSPIPPRMDWVDTNINEGRLVPREAVEVSDILNQYSHGYATPKLHDLAVVVDRDRQHMIAEGGEMLVQVGVIAKAAEHKPVQMHVVVYDESGNKHETFLNETVTQWKKVIQDNSFHGNMTVDTAHTRPKWLTENSLSMQAGSSLKDWMAQLIRLPLTGTDHHFILILGDHTELNKKEAQDVVDMMAVLQAQDRRLSILCMSEKPQFKLLEAMVMTAQGNLVLKNEFFRSDSWFADEWQTVHALTYKDIKVKISGVADVKILDVVSPMHLGINKNQIALNIKNLKSGEQGVVLLKIQVPPMQLNKYRQLLTTKVEYTHPITEKVSGMHNLANIEYAFDVNDALPLRSGVVARSELIMKTHRSLSEVARLIDQKRNYQAIALLTTHHKVLKTFTQKKADWELDRDARVLEKYAANLYEFDETSFQWFKRWKDLTWDKSRFKQQYQ